MIEPNRTNMAWTRGEEAESRGPQDVTLDGLGLLDPVLGNRRGVYVGSGGVGLERHPVDPIQLAPHLNGELQVLPRDR